MCVGGDTIKSKIDFVYFSKVKWGTKKIQMGEKKLKPTVLVEIT